MLTYLKNLWLAAKKDPMTYIGAAIAGLSGLPEIIPQYWSQIEALLPTSAPKESIHHILLGVGAIAAVLVKAHLTAKSTQS